MNTYKATNIGGGVVLFRIERKNKSGLTVSFAQKKRTYKTSKGAENAIVEWESQSPFDSGF